MHRIVVSDTTAITHLAKINALHILKCLYHEILIPDAVYNELTKAKKTQPGALEVINASWIKVTPIKNQIIAAKLKAGLDLGESEAIALAIEQNADLLIIDERKGRIVAKPLVHNIIGMAGILLEAKKAGIISAVEPYIIQLKNTGFRMHNDVFDFILNQAGERNSSAHSK